VYICAAEVLRAAVVDAGIGGFVYETRGKDSLAEGVRAASLA
jgi:hypothetical protein